MNMRDVAINEPGPERIDRFGAVASGLCAVHCAVCALLPAAFGALGLGLLLSHEAEWVFTLIAVVLATGALIQGWRRHRSVMVAGLLVLGIAGLLASRGLEGGSAHHEESHLAPVKHDASPGNHDVDGSDEHGAAPADAHGGSHVDHEDTRHLAGTAVGVGAGFLLLLGHVLNIRTTRQCQKECCA